MCHIVQWKGHMIASFFFSFQRNIAVLAFAAASPQPIHNNVPFRESRLSGLRKGPLDDNISWLGTGPGWVRTFQNRILVPLLPAEIQINS
jgi:hypothetical protein